MSEIVQRTIGHLTNERLQSLDVAGIVTAGLGAVGLFLFPLASGPFAAVFKDLGNADLPALTRIALSTWFPLSLGAIVSCGAVLGLRGGGSLARRRALILGSSVLAAGGVIACVVGMYLPIFSLAGAIKAQ